MKTVTIPISLCNKNLHKEILHIYCWVVHLTRENNNDWFHLDFYYLKQQLDMPIKRISLALNYLYRVHLIDLKKKGSKQYAYAVITEIPKHYQDRFEQINEEYEQLKTTKSNLKTFNYLNPEDILNKNT